MAGALIIFVKEPVPRRVKTRLGKKIGYKEAAAVYTKLLHHTRTCVLQTDASRFVFYADTMPEQDVWCGAAFTRFLQNGEDLGQRMKHAFNTVFELGFEHAVSIGSDCPELSPGLLKQAFQALGNATAVLGPAQDGGYYLLGMRRAEALQQNAASVLFDGKVWSGASVGAQTIRDFERLKWNWLALPQLRDIDEYEDYLYFAERLKTV